MINKTKLPPKPSYTPDPKIMKAIKEKEERKEIAIRLLAGLVSNPSTWQDLTYANMVESAVSLADELIEELNKPTNDKP